MYKITLASDLYINKLINILHFNYFKIIILILILGIGCSDPNEDTPKEEKEEEITELVPLGYSKFTFNKYAPLADKPIDVHTYLPDTTKPDIPIMFVMHGNNRDGRDYCFSWVASAKEYNFLVVCPELDVLQFPTSAEYHLGSIYDSGTPVDSTKWSFNFIEEIYSYLKAEGVTTAETYGLYGHSAGSQFVHRLALFTEPKHASIIIAANAGWYTTINFDESFPYGLKDSPISESQLKEKFVYPIIILLGENDTDPNDSSLRKTEEAMRQGKHRFERGNFFYKMAKDKASELGIVFNWKLETVPNVGHSNTNIAPMAAKLFFK